jgi:hypothetical protein
MIYNSKNFKEGVTLKSKNLFTHVIEKKTGDEDCSHIQKLYSDIYT